MKAAVITQMFCVGQNRTGWLLMQMCCCWQLLRRALGCWWCSDLSQWCHRHDSLLWSCCWESTPESQKSLKALFGLTSGGSQLAFTHSPTDGVTFFSRLKGLLVLQLFEGREPTKRLKVSLWHAASYVKKGFCVRLVVEVEGREGGTTELRWKEYLIYRKEGGQIGWWDEEDRSKADPVFSCGGLIQWLSIRNMKAYLDLCQYTGIFIVFLVILEINCPNYISPLLQWQISLLLILFIYIFF